jgi:hypothetical protein
MRREDFMRRQLHSITSEEETSEAMPAEITVNSESDSFLAKIADALATYSPDDLISESDPDTSFERSRPTVPKLRLRDQIEDEESSKESAAPVHRPSRKKRKVMKRRAPPKRPMSAVQRRAASSRSQGVDDDVVGSVSFGMVSPKPLHKVFSGQVQTLWAEELNEEAQQEVDAIVAREHQKLQQVIQQEIEVRELPEGEAQRREIALQRNQELDDRREQLLEQRLIEDLERLEAARRLSSSNTKYLIEKRMKKALFDLNKRKRLQQQQRRLEAKERQDKQKEIVIDNVRNYFGDQVSLLKEQLLQEQVMRRSLQYEERKIMSAARQERIAQRRKHLVEARTLLQHEPQRKELEELEHLNDAEFEQRLIEIYRTAK